MWVGVGRNALASYLRVGGCWEEKCVTSYLGVGGCREEKCVSLLPRCGWVSGGEMYFSPTYVWVCVGRRNVLASYLNVGGCREEKCVTLLPRCGLMSGGEMC